jgi:hypothetical protein
VKKKKELFNIKKRLNKKSASDTIEHLEALFSKNPIEVQSFVRDDLQKLQNDSRLRRSVDGYPLFASNV